MKNTPETYQTTDFLICSVLFYFEHEIDQIDKTNPNRCIFNIKKRKDTEDLLEKLRKGLLLVDPRRFQSAQKEIKGFLYN